MHRSSELIASLAGALSQRAGGTYQPGKVSGGDHSSAIAWRAERSFRYAPLASGLDIGRKTHGQHEIATVQTTAIDQAAGTVNLTTVLAHASGEWISSDWPVCSIADTASPRRMGAALTYARRYALFTLVGIAGEDDLDAPDLNTPTGAAPEPDTSRPKQNGRTNRQGGMREAPVRPNGKGPTVTRATLAADKSALLRDQLLAELETLASPEAAATWAYRILGVKNSLTGADAKRVEDVFQTTLENLGVE